MSTFSPIAPTQESEAYTTRTGGLAVSTCFSGCAGLFHPAAGAVGVVMVSPFGLEALATARGWRTLAEGFAAAGYPVLRYDHPGTGDSLDPSEPGWAVWREGLAMAVAHLRQLAPVGRVVLLGHGLGATLAIETAAEIHDIALLVALAPVASGRRYLREQAALGALTGAAADGERTLAGGFVLPDRLQSDLRDIDLHRIDPHRLPPVLMPLRPDRPEDSSLADRFDARTLTYAGYDAFVSDPTASISPAETIQELLEAVRIRVPPPPSDGVCGEPGSQILFGDGFQERALRFGPDRTLFAILTEPATAPRETAVVIANAGRDSHIGWGRFSVDLARALARRGHAVLRIDMTGIGESPAPGSAAERELLYGPQHQADILAAVDTMVERGHPRIVLVGRCSGAFAALHAAPRSTAVVGVMPITPLRLVWDPEESVADALKSDIRPLGMLARRAVSPELLLRLVTGEIALRPAARRLADRLVQRLPALGFGRTARLRADALRLMRRLNGRGIRIAFVHSEGDSGLERLAGLFGRGFAGMRRLPRLSLTMIANADHNLNRPSARASVINELGEMLREIE